MIVVVGAGFVICYCWGYDADDVVAAVVGGYDVFTNVHVVGVVSIVCVYDVGRVDVVCFVVVVDTVVDNVDIGVVDVVPVVFLGWLYSCC